MLESGLFEEIFKFLGIIGTATLGYVNYLNKKKVKAVTRENSKLKDNIYQVKIQKIKELYDLRLFSSLEQKIHKIFSDSPVDRFTIMFVMNGKVNFNYLTVLYDESIENLEIGEISPYSDFPIDNTYRDMLSKIEMSGSHWADAPRYDMGVIGDYLRLEKIKSIGWFFVSRIPLDPHNDLLVFCSLSSSEVHIDDTQQRVIQLIFHGRIKGLLKDILEIPNQSHESLVEIFEKREEGDS